MEEKCDRQRCSEKIWRGKHICEGFDYVDTGYGLMFFMCPCACHADITEEETRKKIEDFKKSENL